MNVLNFCCEGAAVFSFSLPKKVLTFCYEDIEPVLVVDILFLSSLVVLVLVVIYWYPAR